MFPPSHSLAGSSVQEGVQSYLITSSFCISLIANQSVHPFSSVEWQFSIVLSEGLLKVSSPMFSSKVFSSSFGFIEVISRLKT